MWTSTYKYFKILLKTHQIITQRNVTLVGKHILDPTDLTSTQIKTILWTAFELKKLSGKNCLSISDSTKPRVVLLMHQPSVILQTAVNRAANLIKFNLDSVIDSEWDTEQFMQDAGKYFSVHTDAILCQTNRQKILNQASVNSKTPFICLSSYIYETIRVLTDMMTLQEHFGYLNHLNFACIGAPCGRINTYLCIVPKLGLNIQYYCCGSNKHNKLSPAKLPFVKRLCDDTKVHLKESKSPKDALQRANIIATSSHNSKDVKLVKDDLKNADPSCVLLPGLPRGIHEVEKELFESKKNLVWQTSRNLEYVIAAAILRVIKKYEHITEKPDFEKLRGLK